MIWHCKLVRVIFLILLFAKKLACNVTIVFALAKVHEYVRTQIKCVYSYFNISYFRYFLSDSQIYVCSINCFSNVISWNGLGQVRSQNNKSVKIGQRHFRAPEDTPELPSTKSSLWQVTIGEY